MFKTELLSVPTHLYPARPDARATTSASSAARPTGPNGEDCCRSGRRRRSSADWSTAPIAALVVTALTMVVALPVAYALGRLDFRGKTALLFTILATRSYPPISIIIPFFYLYIRLGTAGHAAAD